MALHPLFLRGESAPRGRGHTVGDLAGFVDEAGNCDRIASVSAGPGGTSSFVTCSKTAAGQDFREGPGMVDAQ